MNIADQISAHKVALECEEGFLRYLEELPSQIDVDPRWLAIARTQFEQAFMALGRAIVPKARLKLEGDHA